MVDKSAWTARCEWLQSPLGQILLNTQALEISRVLPKTRIGRFGLIFHPRPLFTSVLKTRVRELVCLSPTQPHNDRMALHAACDPQALPLLENTISLCVLPHVLEFTQDPVLAIEEAVSVTASNGLIVITGINPTSFWGIKRLWVRNKMPYMGNYISPNRIRRALRAQNCELIRTRTVYFRLPVRRRRVQMFTRFMEVLGRLCWPAFGGAYVIVAQKQTIPLTPLTAKWRVRALLENRGIIQPTPRSR